MEKLSGIERAIRMFGSEMKLAKVAGVSQVAINKAKRRGKMSAAMAISVSRATRGQVGISDLHPEIYEAVRAEIEGATEGAAA